MTASLIGFGSFMELKQDRWKEWHGSNPLKMPEQSSNIYESKSIKSKHLKSQSVRYELIDFLSLYLLDFIFLFF